MMPRNAPEAWKKHPGCFPRIVFGDIRPCIAECSQQENRHCGRRSDRTKSEGANLGGIMENEAGTGRGGLAVVDLLSECLQRYLDTAPSASSAQFRGAGGPFWQLPAEEGAGVS